MGARLKLILAQVVYVVLALWLLFGSGLHLTIGQTVLLWAVVFSAQYMAVQIDRW